MLLVREWFYDTVPALAHMSVFELNVTCVFHLTRGEANGRWDSGALFKIWGIPYQGSNDIILSFACIGVKGFSGKKTGIRFKHSCGLCKTIILDMIWFHKKMFSKSWVQLVRFYVLKLVSWLHLITLMSTAIAARFHSERPCGKSAQNNKD